MNRTGFYDSLVVNVGVNVEVFPDYVPNNADYPAIAYRHIAGGASVGQDGKPWGLWDTWRISVVGKTRQECDVLLLQLNQLAGTKNEHFQQFSFLYEGDNESIPEDNYFSSTIDFKTYDR